MGTNAPAPEVAVGAVCVRDGCLLLVLRGAGAGAGRWAVPGGRLARGESLTAAVTRELCEETGLRGHVTGLCGVAERHVDGHHYVIVNHWVEVTTGEAVAGDDAAAVMWATRADVDTIELVPGMLAFLAEHGVLEHLH